jgi:DNA invertase Pin-like site-specific DNA recombinase
MSKKQTIRACVLYARISVALEESVSIERQIEAGQKYADARGWKVVGTFVDEGVSATHNKPENRAGWRAMLASTASYDAVVVWKIDRLARRALDFLNADEALRARGAGIVAVEDPIDMTTPQGRGFATMLAVFAEMEAASISARVAAARTHLLKNQRVVGGAVPYGWRSIPNPAGPGYLLATRPGRIEHVQEMVARVQRGESIYSVVQWLNDAGIPSPTGKQEWVYSSVERLLRNPVLAGMTAFNPGNRTKVRGTDVLRGADGLPVVGGFGIMTPAEWRAMVSALDSRTSAQSLPRAQKATTSGLLSGLVWCADCDVRMHRGTTQGRQGYKCPSCFQTITNFEDAVVGEFLRMKGERVRWTVVTEEVTGGEVALPEIELAIAELRDAQNRTDDDDIYEELEERIRGLRKLRREARESTPETVLRMEPANFFGEDWEAATTDADRQAIIRDAIARIHVRRTAKGGQRTDAAKLARLTFDWKQPDDLGPLSEE